MAIWACFFGETTVLRSHEGSFANGKSYPYWNGSSFGVSSGKRFIILTRRDYIK